MKYARSYVIILYGFIIDISEWNGRCDFENNNNCSFTFEEFWKIHSGIFRYNGRAKLIPGGHSKGSRNIKVWVVGSGDGAG